MEDFGSLELLVKLASFGTAGVCVLAIFLIGNAILKLPNDAPKWKPDLMKKFINACILIAVITTISGGLTAYFNQGKVQVADEKAKEADKGTAIVATEYESLVKQYNYLAAKVDTMQMLTSANTRNSAAVSQPDRSTKKVLTGIKIVDPKPINKLLNEKSTYMINKSKLEPNPGTILQKKQINSASLLLYQKLQESWAFYVFSFL